MTTYRDARKSDLSAILLIEHNSHPKPWDEKAFICEFSKQAAGSNIFLSALDEDGGLAGFVCGNVIVDYVHIINIAVRDGQRRKGIAAGLIKRVEQEAFRRKLGSITLEARETNTAAISLYKKLGYLEKGRREKAYDNREDEIIMWKYLI